jgi:hypothetical protein
MWGVATSGWSVNMDFSSIEVDDIRFQARATNGIFVTETSQRVDMWQDYVYDFGLMYDLTLQEPVTRHISLHGFISDSGRSGWRTKYEYFTVLQGDTFELWIYLMDEDAKAIDYDQMVDFIWWLEGSDGEIILSKQLTEYDYMGTHQGAVVFLVTTDDTLSLLGRYHQEAQVLFSNGEVITPFHGVAEFLGAKRLYDST